MRDLIISEIRKIAAANEGRPPGKLLFQTHTGIGESKWAGVYWSKWGDALSEAGFAPNEWTARLDTDQVLRTFAQMALRLGHVPTTRELGVLRRSDASAPSARLIVAHFGGRDQLVDALRSLAERDSEYSSLAPILPRPSATSRTKVSPAKDGWVYLIKWGDSYKIGRGSELERRVKQVSTALPDKGTLLHSIKTDDPPGIEAYWHRRFADRRANGEWFKLSPTDVKAFQRRSFQ